MSTFVLLPGAGSDSWYWHRVAPLLQADGHDVVAVDLPVDDDSAGLVEYADAAAAAVVGHRAGRAPERLVVVAQSMGAFTAGLLCERLPVDLLVLVAGMTPAPGESPGDWWVGTGHDLLGVDMSDPEHLFLHDVPAEVAAASTEHVRDQPGTPFAAPWPLERWPDVPTRFLLCRDDRLFPAEFQRRVVRERLGITPDEMDGGHLPALAHPEELARRLLSYAKEIT